MPKKFAAEDVVEYLWKIWEQDDYMPFDAIHTFLHEVAEQYIDENVKMQIDVAKDAMYDAMAVMEEEE